MAGPLSCDTDERELLVVHQRQPEELEPVAGARRRPRAVGDGVAERHDATRIAVGRTRIVRRSATAAAATGGACCAARTRRATSATGAARTRRATSATAARRARAAAARACARRASRGAATQRPQPCRPSHRSTRHFALVRQSPRPQSRAPESRRYYRPRAHTDQGLRTGNSDDARKRRGAYKLPLVVPSGCLSQSPTFPRSVQGITRYSDCSATFLTAICISDSNHEQQVSGTRTLSGRCASLFVYLRCYFRLSRSCARHLPNQAAM